MFRKIRNDSVVPYAGEHGFFPGGTVGGTKMENDGGSWGNTKIHFFHLFGGTWGNTGFDIVLPKFVIIIILHPEQKFVFLALIFIVF